MQFEVTQEMWQDMKDRVAHSHDDVSYELNSLMDSLEQYDEVSLHIVQERGTHWLHFVFAHAFHGSVFKLEDFTLEEAIMFNQKMYGTSASFVTGDEGAPEDQLGSVLGTFNRLDVPAATWRV